MTSADEEVLFEEGGVPLLPSTDNRTYSTSILPNGLTVLFITTDDADAECSAAMAVKCGWYDEPVEIGGLAHFCEHMLFMGTAEHPGENEWERYLSRHGGDSNAATDSDCTTFSFEVHHKYLLPALEMFSGFFASPLMLHSAVDREVEAVNSEFEDVLRSDGIRLDDVMRETSGKPDHVNSKFGWGNNYSLRTLTKERGIDLREAVLNFHHRFYRAENMRLVVCGKSIDEKFKRRVAKAFGRIPSFDEKCPMPERKAEHPYADSALGTMTYVVPCKERHMLRLEWHLPCQTAYYKTHALFYVSHLAGHEAKGSLMALLKREELATYTYVEEEGRISECTPFTIDIGLTEKGVAEVFRVISLVFQYLAMLRHRGPQEAVWRELAAMGDIAFDQLEKTNAFDYATQLAEDWFYLPTEDLIRGSVAAYDDYNADLISECLAHCVPVNCRFSLSSKLVNGGDHSNFHESKYHQAKYSVRSLPASDLERWLYPDQNDIHKAFDLPRPNLYIPTDFTVVGRSENSSSSPSSFSDAAAATGEGKQRPASILLERKELGHPVLLDESDHGSVYHKLDREFLVPKCYLRLKLSSKLAYSSSHNSVMNTLMKNLLVDWLSEDLYDATISELEICVEAWRCGIVVTVQGMSQHAPNVMLETIRYFRGMVNAETGELHDAIQERLKTKVNSLVRDYKNSQRVPMDQATNGLRLLLKEPYFTLESRLKLLSSYELADVRIALAKYIRTFQSSLHGTFYSHGSITATRSEELFQELRDVLQWSPLTSPAADFSERLVLLSHGKTVVLKQVTRDVKQQNCAIKNYYQCGAGTIRIRVLTELVAHMMAEPCFDYLRTKLALGYDVSAQWRQDCNAYGITVSIQSPSPNTPELLDARIEEFLAYYYDEVLAKMSEKEFGDVVEGLIGELKVFDYSIQAQAGRYFQELETRSAPCFARRRLHVAYLLNNTSLEQIRRFFKEHLLDRTTRRKLSSRVAVLPGREATPLMLDLWQGMRDTTTQPTTTTTTTTARGDEGVEKADPIVQEDKKEDAIVLRSLEQLYIFKAQQVLLPAEPSEDETRFVEYMVESGQWPMKDEEAPERKEENDDDSSSSSSGSDNSDSDEEDDEDEDEDDD